MARTVALALGLAVLVVHLVLLHTLGTLWQTPTRLQAMATPMFTRELVSSAAPPPVVVSPPKPPARPPRRPHEATRPAPAHAADQAAAEPPQPSVPDGGSVTSTVTASPVPDPADPAPSTPPAASATLAAASAAVPAVAAASAAATAPGGPSSGPIVGPAPSLPSATPTLAAATPPPDSWPADTRLSYRLTGNYRGPIGGDARVQWQRDGSRYQVRVDLALSGLNLFTMTSQGQVTPDGLLPSAYEEKRLGTNPLQVAMEDRQIRLYDGRRVERPAEAQDTASQFVELGHRFSTGREALQVGKAVQLWLARPAAVAEWTYDIVGLETLHSARLGAIEAYHLKPRPLTNPSGPITAEMWFAPTLQYLPVRIKITMSAETWVDLLIDKIEQATPATAPQTPPTP